MRILMLGMLCLVALPVAAVDAASRNDSDKGFVDLTRGPVHEAFAEPVALNVTTPMTVARKPPDTIDEIPPAQRPGDNAFWIPGYWIWDDDRDDFIWVSGVWRVAPHGQRWVAGYWTEAAGGYRRISGFWTAETVSEVAYQPEPPETQESGPVGEAPGDDYFWVPGCWLFQDSRYAWRPGYWSRSYDNWIWTPNRYVWTPRGAIFCRGYWDYGWEGRGQLFAPVYFSRPLYRDAGFRYSPSVAVSLGGLQIHLFSRPSYHHYYFGDYYADRYDRAGFYPWFAFSSWHGYDPFYHYHWSHDGHHRRDWDDQWRTQYRHYRDNENLRPAHTYADMRRDIERGNIPRGSDNVLATSLDEAIRDNRRGAAPFKRVTDDERREISRHARETQNVVQSRRAEVERSERVAARPTPDGQRPRSATSVLRLPDQPATERRSTATEGRAPRDTDRPESRRPTDNRREERPNARTERPQPTRPEAERPRAERPRTERPEGRPEAKPETRTPREERPQPERPRTPERRAEEPQRPTERPAPRAERPAPREEKPAPRAERPAPRAERPSGDRNDGDRPRRGRDK